MSLTLDVQTACTEPAPEEAELRRWLSCALAEAGHTRDAEISLRFTNDIEMAALNSHYRHRAGSTNVLSFPADLPPGLDLPLLGDIAVCAPVVLREAREQGKPARNHWAHMTVHGCLHLLGYDHIEAADAELMEALETRILGVLGLPCPYTLPIEEEPVAS
ncbi:MAG: rRNA maturation RNase YbeY [Gammaproteobacteria bacterium]